MLLEDQGPELLLRLTRLHCTVDSIPIDDPKKVARYDKRRIATLLADAAIAGNRAKIKSARFRTVGDPCIRFLLCRRGPRLSSVHSSDR